MHLDVDPEDIDVRLVFGKPEFPPSVLKAIEKAEAARSKADTAAFGRQKSRSPRPWALVREAHLSMRDAAEVLGVSHARPTAPRG